MNACFRWFFLIFAFLLTACKTQVDPRLIMARQGRMDLTSWDIAGKGKIALDGEWEFYGNQLLTPEDFKKDSTKKPDDLILVPGSWNDPATNSKNFSGQYGTYRLIITHCPGPELMALRLVEANSSYLLWINNGMVAGNGRVSSNRDSVVSKEIPLLKVFPKPPGDSLQIVIQVANFFHAKGG